MTMVKHSNGKPDNRYQCALEYCGYSYPMFIVRFCGDRIGAARGIDKARHIAETHAKERLKS